jgi:hypothetical protein
MIHYIESTTLEHHPLEWQRAGLQETTTGYGLKLTTPYKVRHEGRLFRVYATCVSNVASYWIMCKGQKLHVHDHATVSQEETS